MHHLYLRNHPADRFCTWFCAWERWSVCPRTGGLCSEQCTGGGTHLSKCGTTVVHHRAGVVARAQVVDLVQVVL